MTLPDRRLSALLILGGAVAVAALAGCTGDKGGDPVVAGEDGFPRDTLVIAAPSDANTMISVVSQSASDSNIMSNIYLPLLDSDFDCELNFKAGLAKEWSWNEDGTVLSMTLRDDISWQDGNKVDAADVAFTMSLVENPIVASPRVAYLQNMVEGKRPLVIDDTHIEWHFTHAYDRTTQAAHASSVELVPEHLLKDADPAMLRGHPFNREPIVDGRWKIATWESGQRIVLEANDAWTGPKDQAPKLKRVIFRVLPEYATRLIELEKGSIDLMESIEIADADRLAREHPEITLHRRGWRAMDYVGWNSIDPADLKEKRRIADDKRKVRFAEIEAMAASDEEKKKLKDEASEALQVKISDVKPHPIFGDRAVRTALTKAIDRQKIISDLLKSETTGEVYGRESVGTITPELCSAFAEDVQPLPYDLVQAKAELAAVGWTDSDGDGILDKNGLPMRFTLETNSENPRRAKAAIIIQANLKQLGADVQIEKLEFNTFSEKHRQRDFDASLGGWSAGLFIDPTVIWGDPDHNEFNFVGYDNKEVQALMDHGLTIPDPALAAPIWKDVQRKIYEDQPYTFLYWRDEIVGLSSRFKDPKIDVLSPYRDLHQWWVPAEEVKYKR